MSPHNKGHGRKAAAVEDSSTAAASSEADSIPAPAADDEYVARPSKRMEVTIALVALVATVLFFFAAQGIELRREAAPGQIDARFWPTILALLGIALSTSRLIVVLTRPADSRVDLEVVQRRGVAGLLIAIVLTIVYIAVWSAKSFSLHLFGYVFGFNAFVFATPFYLAALLYLFGSRSWKAIIIYAIVTTAFIYLVFGQLLRIAL
ncbi:MAG: tripartite tricarboxylate transporter TctB family protein [Homoserinimonas sp.]